jgi:AraC family transcriptional regulator
MDADIYTLYESAFYRVLDFKCRCKDCYTSKPEYSESFGISFVRKGNFLFNVFRNSLDSYNGCVLITKPGYERTVTHMHAVPDECSIFDFNIGFYKELVEQYKGIPFLTDPDLHSSLVKSNPDLDFMHLHIINLILEKCDKLKIDSLVIELIETVLRSIADYKPRHSINERLKKNHLVTIERAKEYIARNFTKDISLMDIAAYCYVSVFHFGRIFKTFTSYSPHQYLLSIRLKNSEMLLRDTNIPVGDVAFASGFNSIEYFTAAFKNKYQAAPSKFRTRKM